MKADINIDLSSFGGVRYTVGKQCQYILKRNVYIYSLFETCSSAHSYWPSSLLICQHLFDIAFPYSSVHNSNSFADVKSLGMFSMKTPCNVLRHDNFGFNSCEKIKKIALYFCHSNCNSTFDHHVGCSDRMSG